MYDLNGDETLTCDLMTCDLLTCDLMTFVSSGYDLCD